MVYIYIHKNDTHIYIYRYYIQNIGIIIIYVNIIYIIDIYI